MSVFCTNVNWPHFHTENNKNRPCPGTKEQNFQPSDCFFRNKISQPIGWRYGHFSGINRKIQIKYQPKGWHRRSSSEDGEASCDPSLVLILKWGGELTPAGRVQAEELGRIFRCMYPGGQEERQTAFESNSSGDTTTSTKGLGLLRLHSTYRHDLKIYASDEGRVQMTAAAFAKGLLALEGELTPILVQMVKSANTNGLLDNDCDAYNGQNMVKRRLHEAFQLCKDFTAEDYEYLNPTNSRSIDIALRFVKNPFKMCQRIHKLILTLNDFVEKKSKDDKALDLSLYHGESWDLMQSRWAKLEKDFKTKHFFDLSKVPDIYDCIKYDLQHNHHTIQFQKAEELYKCSKYLADIVIPQEYGITKSEKLSIGLGICTPLLKKIRADLLRNIEVDNNEGESVNRLNPMYSKGVSSPGRHVRTRLYFTSESHLHSLLTVLRFGGLFDETTDEQWKRAMDYVGAVSELNYLSQIVIMLYEDPTKDLTSDNRFHVELHFSPGVNCCVHKNLPVGPGFRTKTSNELESELMASFKEEEEYNFARKISIEEIATLSFSDEISDFSDKIFNSSDKVPDKGLTLVGKVLNIPEKPAFSDSLSFSDKVSSVSKKIPTSFESCSSFSDKISSVPEKTSACFYTLGSEKEIDHNLKIEKDLKSDKNLKIEKNSIEENIYKCTSEIESINIKSDSVEAKNFGKKEENEKFESLKFGETVESFSNTKKEKDLERFCKNNLTVDVFETSSADEIKSEIVESLDKERRWENCVVNESELKSFCEKKKDNQVVENSDIKTGTIQLDVNNVCEENIGVTKEVGNSGKVLEYPSDKIPLGEKEPTEEGDKLIGKSSEDAKNEEKNSKNNEKNGRNRKTASVHAPWNVNLPLTQEIMKKDNQFSDEKTNGPDEKINQADVGKENQAGEKTNQLSEKANQTDEKENQAKEKTGQADEETSEAGEEKNKANDKTKHRVENKLADSQKSLRSLSARACLNEEDIENKASTHSPPRTTSRLSKFRAIPEKHRHSLGHLSSYQNIITGFHYKNGLAPPSVPVFSTAVISGSTSAPDLRDDFAPLPFTSGLEILGGVPSIRPLETLHNALSLRKFDRFLEKVTHAHYKLASCGVNSPSSSVLGSGPPSFISSPSFPSSPTSVQSFTYSEASNSAPNFSSNLNTSNQNLTTEQNLPSNQPNKALSMLPPTNSTISSRYKNKTETTPYTGLIFSLNDWSPDLELNRRSISRSRSNKSIQDQVIEESAHECENDSMEVSETRIPQKCGQSPQNTEEKETKKDSQVSTEILENATEVLRKHSEAIEILQKDLVDFHEIFHDTQVDPQDPMEIGSDEDSGSHNTEVASMIEVLTSTPEVSMSEN